jgi:hypothetical protein
MRTVRPARLLPIARQLMIQISNGFAVVGLRRPITSRPSGAIMKILTSADLFSPPKRKRKTKERFARAKLVVAVARDCAVEKAQQRAAPSMTRPPTVLQRRRLAERLGAKS